MTTPPQDAVTAVPIADRLDLVHFSGRAVEMREDDELHIRIELKRLFQRLGAHVPDSHVISA